MCLTHITKKFAHNDKMIVGYKIFVEFIRDFSFGGEYHQVSDDGYKIGKPYKAESGMLMVERYGRKKEKFYDNGFHCLEKQEEAEHYLNNMSSYSQIYILVEVLAWDIRAIGKQSGYDCFISKNIRPMRILKRRKKKALPSNEIFSKPDDSLKVYYRKEVRKEVTLLRRSIKSKLDNEEKHKLYLKAMLTSYEKYAELVCVIDQLSRNSSDFLSFTKHHMRAFKENKEYQEFYYRLIEDGKNMFNVKNNILKIVSKHYSNKPFAMFI